MGFPGIFWRTYGRNCLKFVMLLHLYYITVWVRSVDFPHFGGSSEMSNLPFTGTSRRTYWRNLLKFDMVMYRGDHFHDRLDFMVSWFLFFRAYSMVPCLSSGPFATKGCRTYYPLMYLFKWQSMFQYVSNTISPPTDLLFGLLVYLTWKSPADDFFAMSIRNELPVSIYCEIISAQSLSKYYDVNWNCA